MIVVDRSAISTREKKVPPDDGGTIIEYERELVGAQVPKPHVSVAGLADYVGLACLASADLASVLKRQRTSS